MTKSETQEITKTLSRTDVHDQWETDFRTDENAAFYAEAYDYITRTLNAPEGSTIMEVGCGIGAHSVLLAKRGFKVKGIDFSQPVLVQAEENIKREGLEDKVSFQHEDVLDLTFPDESFEYVMCWGVLMHIKEVERAISEISRILKPGGKLVLSEGNMHSMQSMGLRVLKKILGKESANLNRTNIGMEHWTQTTAGTLLTRHADISGLIKELSDAGLVFKKRTAGQFTETYTRFHSGGIKKLIHLFNHVWFKYIRFARPAFGNILFLEKEL